MAVSTQNANGKPQPKDKPQVKPWQVAIAVVALVGFMVWMGIKNFGPAPQIENEKTRTAAELIAKVSPQAGPDGDLSKVNAADRDAFLKQFAGAPVSPVAVLRNYWKSKH